MLECKGYRYWTDCGYEYDCDYPNATFACEYCIINGGEMSPQTGKLFRGNRSKYVEQAKAARNIESKPISIEKLYLD